MLAVNLEDASAGNGFSPIALDGSFKDKFSDRSLVHVPTPNPRQFSDRDDYSAGAVTRQALRPGAGPWANFF